MNDLKSIPLDKLVVLQEEKAKAMPTVRDCSNLQVGEVCRQGDVYIQYMGVNPKDVKLLYETQNRQLVPGVTNGSRHIVQENPHTKIWKCKPSHAYRLPNAPRDEIAAGPAVVSRDGWTLMHPTHPFCAKFPAGTCQIWYQVDAKTNQRTKD